MSVLSGLNCVDLPSLVAGVTSGGHQHEAIYDLTLDLSQPASEPIGDHDNAGLTAGDGTEGGLEIGNHHGSADRLLHRVGPAA